MKEIYRTPTSKALTSQVHNHQNPGDASPHHFISVFRRVPCCYIVFVLVHNFGSLLGYKQNFVIFSYFTPATLSRDEDHNQIICLLWLGIIIWLQNVHHDH